MRGDSYLKVFIFPCSLAIRKIMDIKNSISIVTGGASGLGAATAKALVHRGVG
jgi:hypothetical protein